MPKRDRKTTQNRGPSVRVSAYCIAGAGLALMLGRVVSATAFQRFDTTALVLFAIACAGVLVPDAWPRLRKLKYGDAEVEFGDLERLPSVQATDSSQRTLPSGVTAETAGDWTKVRSSPKADSRDVFLAHVIRPSKAIWAEIRHLCFTHRDAAHGLARRCQRGVLLWQALGKPRFSR